MSVFYDRSQIEEQPPRRIWIRGIGWETVRVWQGSPEAINGFIAELQKTFARIETGKDGDYATVQATIPSAEDGTISPEDEYVDSWQLLGNDIELSLFQHPKALAEIKQLQTNGTLHTFRKDFDEALANYTDPDTVNWNNPSTPSAHWPNLVDVYKQHLAGVTSYPVSQYVLRHTRTVPPNTNLRPVLTNVNKIYTSAQLTSVESVPSTILFTLPDGYWLKRTPTVEQIAGGKFQFTQEYWHSDDYSDWVYDAVS